MLGWSSFFCSAGLVWKHSAILLEYLLSAPKLSSGWKLPKSTILEFNLCNVLRVHSRPTSLLVLSGEGDAGLHLSSWFLMRPLSSCFPILFYSQLVVLGIRICVNFFITITLCLRQHVGCFRDIFVKSWAIFLLLEINQRTGKTKANLKPKPGLLIQLSVPKYSYFLLFTSVF